MLSWVSKLAPEGQFDSAARKVETNLTDLGIQWIAADHPTKLACGQLMADVLRRLIPDYDFGRNIHVQFLAFVIEKPVEMREQAAKQFSENAAAARTQDPALFIALGFIGLLFTLFAINARARRAATRQRTGDLYTNHCRNINDVIQYALFFRAI